MLNNARGFKATILLSHTHWDHIQGLPFFEPLLGRRNRFDLYGPRRVNMNLKDVLAHQFLEPYLPFAYRSLAANLHIHEVVAGDTHQTERANGHYRWRFAPPWRLHWLSH